MCEDISLSHCLLDENWGGEASEAMFLFILVADGKFKTNWPGFKPVYVNGAGIPERGACGFSGTTNGVLDLS